jgi:uncharacterized repeat protein (TIGR02543 family)
MRKRITRKLQEAFALVLTAAMLLSLSMPMAWATEGADVTEITPEITEAAPEEGQEPPGVPEPEPEPEAEAENGFFSLLSLGDIDDPIEIATKEDLAALRTAVNDGESYAGKYILVTADIDLEDEPWTPIGNAAARTFNGNFNGGGHTISGLYINATTAYQGLFGYINGASFSNLTVSGSIISTNSYVGGIAANAATGAVSFDNVTSDVILTGSANVGGLLGNTSIAATFEDCEFKGAISQAYVGSSTFGGLVGYATAAVTIEDCVNSGALTGGGYVGGLVGDLRGGPSAITRSYNTGNITGTVYAGGLVGYDTALINVSDSYNTGEISGTAPVGGLFGAITGANSTLSGSYNTGSVTGTGNYVGGLAGQASAAPLTVTDCYNTAPVKAGNYAAGLIGQFNGANSKLLRSRNSGSVTATAGYAGGLIANSASAAITVADCLNSGSVTGTTRAAGINANGTSAAAVYSGVLNSGILTANATYRFKFSYMGTFINCYTVEDCAGPNPTDGDPEDDWWGYDEEYGVWYPGWDVIKVSGAALTNGELAWGLDGGDGERSNLWVQGASAPEFTSPGNRNFIYKVITPETTPDGTVSVGNTFNGAGNSIEVTAAPADGKIRRSISLMNSTTGKPVAYTQDGNVFTFTMPQANVWVEAEFGSTPEGAYTVTFADGETWTQQEVGAPDYKAVKPTDPVSGTGKVFAGWYLNSKEFDFNTVISGDITLTAHWKSSAGDIEIDLYLNYPGSADYSLTAVSGKINPVDPVRPAPGVYDDYGFTGWYTAGGVYVDVANRVFTSDAELYAHWRQIDLFEENGGTYEFTAQEQLFEFASRVNGTNSDKLRFPKSYAGKTFTLLNDIELTEAWSAIGYAVYTSTGTIDAANSKPFAGTFDGGGFTISGLAVGAADARAAADFQGLFGYATGAIKNLTVTGEVYSSGKYTGGVVGYTTVALTNVAFGGTDTQSVVNSTGDYVGGIAGYSASTAAAAESAVNRAAVTGRDYVGGVAGGTAGPAGTLATATYINTENYGEISGRQAVGGLVGGTPAAQRVNFADAVNYGDVTATGDYAGGLIGGSPLGFVGLTSSANNGAVSGAARVGGLIGGSEGLYTTAGWSANNGSVTATGDYVGGIIGWWSATSTTVMAVAVATKLANTGNVSGLRYVGGIVGYKGGIRSATSMTFLWSTGDVTGKSNYQDIAGLFGYTLGNAMTISNSYATGRVINLGSGGAVGIINIGTGVTATNSGYFNAETPRGVSGTNCWYLAPSGAIDGATGQPLTQEQYEEGYAAYYLNNKASGNFSFDETTPIKLNDTAARIYLAQLTPRDASGRLSVTFENGKRAALTTEGTQTFTLTVDVEDAASHTQEGENTPVFDPAGSVAVADDTYTITLANNDALITYWLAEDVTEEFEWYLPSATTYTLTTEAHLRGFAQLVNEGNTLAGKTLNLGADVTLTQPWIPAGSVAVDGDGKAVVASSRVFAGTFNGGGRTITGMKIGTAEEPYTENGAAFIAAVTTTGQVNNLTFEGAEIYSTGDYVGAAVGYLYRKDTTTGGSVASIKALNTTIRGANYVGGLLGYAEAYSGANIDSYYGYTQINNSAVFGALTGDTSSVAAIGDYVGGIAGYAVVPGNQNIAVENYAPVTGRDYVGGVAGGTFSAYYSAAKNYGAVNGRNYVGGIIGGNEAGGNSFTYLTYNNTGGVTATGDYAGGFIGYVGGAASGLTTNNTAGRVYVNTGTVTAYGSYAGGVIGGVRDTATMIGDVTNYSSIRNEGSVTAANYAGGVVGAAASARLRHVANTGAVVATAGSKAGALLGGTTGASGTAEIASSFSKTVQALSGAADTSYKNTWYLGTATADGLGTVAAEDFTSGRLSWLLEKNEVAPESAYYWTADATAPIFGSAATSYYRVTLTDPDTRENLAVSGWVELPGGVSEMYVQGNINPNTIELVNKLKDGYSAVFMPVGAVNTDLKLAWALPTTGTGRGVELEYRVGTTVTGDTAWYDDAVAEDPDTDSFTITTQEELVGLAWLVNGSPTVSFEGKTVALGNDIALTGANWTPIGASAGNRQFKGTFDGDGNKITGLTAVASAGDLGLFGQTMGGAIVNLTVTGIVAGGVNTGGIVGYAKGTRIENVTFGTSEGESKVNGGATAVNAGGIAGLTEAAAANGVVVFKDVKNYAAVSGALTNTVLAYSAGIVAQVNTPATALVLDNAQNYGSVTRTVTATGATANAAGLVYQNAGGSIIVLNSKNDGAVTAQSSLPLGNVYTSGNVGGLVGNAQKLVPGASYKGVDYSGFALYIGHSENNGAVTVVTRADTATQVLIKAGGAAAMAYLAVKIDDFTNNGAIRTITNHLTTQTPNASAAVGGLLGDATTTGITGIEVVNSVNNGNIRLNFEGSTGNAARYVGGILGNLGRPPAAAARFSFTDCVNNGNLDESVGWTGVSGGYSYFAGILGNSEFVNSGVTAELIFERCGNTGNITSAYAASGSYAAGLFAYTRSLYGKEFRVTASYNTGDITAVNYATGLGFDLDNITKFHIQGSFNTGRVSATTAFAVSNLVLASAIDASYYTPGVGAADDTTAPLWSGDITGLEFAGRLNRAANCADAWAKGAPHPVYAGDDAVRSLRISSVSAVPENAVTVTPASAIVTSSDGLIWAAKDTTLYLNFATPGGTIVKLVTITDESGNEVFADSNLSQTTIKLRDYDYRTLVRVLFATKDTSRDDYTVVFDLNGGSGDGTEPQTVVNGGKATKPADPTHGDALFLGWFDESDTEWNFEAAVLDDMTLTAKWLDGFSVTYDRNYTGAPAEATKLIAYGTRVPNPGNPARPDLLNVSGTKTAEYKFLGWFTAPTGGDKWNFDDILERGDARLTPASPLPTLTLYAHWDEVAVNQMYTVIFNPNFPGANTSTVTVKLNELIPVPEEPVRPPLTVDGGTVTAYRFIAWVQLVSLGGGRYTLSDPVDFSTFTSASAQTITMYATWERVDDYFDNTFIEIDSEELMKAFIKAVDGGKVFTGQTITITRDVTVDGTNWDRVGGNVTLLDPATLLTTTPAFRGTLTASAGAVLTLNNLSRPIFDAVGADGAVRGLTLSGSTHIDRPRPVQNETFSYAFVAAQNNGEISGCAVQDAKIFVSQAIPVSVALSLPGAMISTVVAYNMGVLSDCTADNCEIEYVVRGYENTVLPNNNVTSGLVGIFAGRSDTALANLVTTGGYVRVQPTLMNAGSNSTLGSGMAGGGIAGRGFGNELHNDGTDVSGGAVAGGIFGVINGGIAENCTNSGTITSTEAAGGIAGMLSNSTNGAVGEGDPLAGEWLAGTGKFAPTSMIRDCENTGEIFANMYLQNATNNIGGFGGIAGVAGNSTMITDCVNGKPGQELVLSDAIRNFGGILGRGQQTYMQITRVEKSINYMTFTATPGAYAQYNIGGIVGGAARVEACANVGNLILPNAVGVGGLGGGASVDSGDTSYAANAYGDGPLGTATANCVSMFFDCLFYGKVVSSGSYWRLVSAANYSVIADSGVLVGGAALTIDNCVWLDVTGTANPAKAKLAGEYVKSFRYHGPYALGASDMHFASADRGSVADDGGLAFAKWDDVLSGALAWELDGGEGAHREVWTHHRGDDKDMRDYPVPGKPTIWRLEVTIGSEDTITIYLRENESFELPPDPEQDSYELDGNLITVTYKPQVELTNVTSSGSSVSPKGNGTVKITYDTETTETPIPEEPEEPEDPVIVPPPVVTPPEESGDGDGDGAGTGDGNVGGDGEGTGAGLGDGDGQSAQGTAGNPSDVTGGDAVSDTSSAQSEQSSQRGPARTEQAPQQPPDEVIPPPPPIPPEATPTPSPDPEPEPEIIEETAPPLADMEPEHEETATAIQTFVIIAGIIVGLGALLVIILLIRRKAKERED